MKSSRSSKGRSHAEDRSFAGHYGEAILADGVAPIPRALFLYGGALGLSPQQVWFVCCVLSHKWDGSLPHPRLGEMARLSTLSLRQIKNIKSSLVEAGFLEVLPRYSPGGAQEGNAYDFGRLLTRLEDIILADPPAGMDELAEDGVPAPHVPEEQAATQRWEASTSDQISDHSFVARYGRVLLRCGMAALPRCLFSGQADLGLSPQQVWFTGYILSFQWSTHLPYPSLRKMAARTGYSERQIHRIKSSLIEGGYLRVVERHSADGGDTTSAYDFSGLFSALNSLVRRQQSSDGTHEKEQAAHMDTGYAVDGVAPEGPDGPEAVTRGGEAGVSGRVQLTSEGGETYVSGGVKPESEKGVKQVSVGRVKPVSYEIESIQEEPDKEESHQQQGAPYFEKQELTPEQETACTALVGVGVIPSIALDLAQACYPDDILEWVRYYLSVLSKQENLSNPVGVLVSRLRAGEEPPTIPSSGDLQSLRLKMSHYRWMAAASGSSANSRRHSDYDSTHGSNVP